MKRSYPYTGPGAPAGGGPGQPIGTAYGQAQPPPPAGPAPPLPAGPNANLAPTQSYANYGYGQVASGRASSQAAGTSNSAGLTATDAQQAQWHQQWQQYYAQQAAVTAAAALPASSQQAGPQQSSGYVPGRVGPSPQPASAQAYTPAYPQHQHQPQQGGYQYPQQQSPAVQSQQPWQQPPATQQFHQGPMPQAQGMQQQQQHGGVQGAPPAKRTRYDQHQAAAVPPFVSGGMAAPGSQFYGPGHVGGASPPNLPSGTGPAGASPMQSFGWQGAGAGTAMGGPGPGMGGASPMGPMGGAGRGAAPGRGRGGGPFGGPPGQIGSPMSQGGSPGGPQAMRGVGRGGVQGSPVVPPPFAADRGAVGWGARGGPNMVSIGRRSGSTGADRGGRAGGMSARGGGGSAGGGGRAGFSSQNTIPLNAPNGPASSRAGRDASKLPGSRGSGGGGSHGPAASGSGGRGAVNGSDAKRTARGAAPASESGQGSGSKKSVFFDFQIRSVDIDAIDWSWSATDDASDDDKDDGEDDAADASRDVEDNGGEASSTVGEEAAGGGEAKDAGGAGASGSSGTKDDSSSTAAAAGRDEPPRGPRNRWKKGSGRAKGARAKAANAVSPRDSTRLRITFGTPANLGPEGAPTGPKADKNASKKQQRKAQQRKEAGASSQGDSQKGDAAAGAAGEEAKAKPEGGDAAAGSTSAETAADAPTSAAATATEHGTDAPKVEAGVESGEQGGSEADGPSRAGDWSAASKSPPQHSANRVTITFAGAKKRLLIDADAVKSLSVDRAAGRIEVVVRVVTAPVQPSAAAVASKSGKKWSEWVVCKGVLLESRGQDQSGYQAVARHQIEEAWKQGSAQPPREGTADDATQEGEAPVSDDTAAEDKEGEPKDAEGAQKADGQKTDAQESEGAGVDLGPLADIPPFYRLLASHNGPAEDLGHAASTIDEMTIVAHLDTASPLLVEPTWVKTGDADSCITQLATYSQRPQDHEWHGRIHVVDPDPPPTLDSVLDEWCTESFLGSAKERKSFLAETVSSAYDARPQNGSEAVQRDEEREALNRTRIKALVDIMGRMIRSANGPSVSLDALSGPLAAAARDSQSSSHSVSSLCVLALSDMALRFSQAAGVSSEEIRRSVCEMMMQFPRTALFKTLDNVWKERMEKMRQSAASGAGQKRKRDKDREGDDGDEGGDNDKTRTAQSTPAPAPTSTSTSTWTAEAAGNAATSASAAEQEAKVEGDAEVKVEAEVKEEKAAMDEAETKAETGNKPAAEAEVEVKDETMQEDKATVKGEPEPQGEVGTIEAAQDDEEEGQDQNSKPVEEAAAVGLDAADGEATTLAAGEDGDAATAAEVTEEVVGGTSGSGGGDVSMTTDEVVE
ncbi:uncharacterized protein PFL1_04754 [Pseudozyma flocculosa PF-1]|uniref:Uncharacterized protein n=1 Tax=Pseudozyma flocculosa PF-1 TaxID=1277687 RepID=A0A061HAK2_9BASI|nr:uncharacterized protein PFL1_04754 [Pseudozyma flocculosa PF-1]EPQ27616.1 hypothetical protein PFL1_04754 [Pseudozyma flocculosa PF-1]